MVPRPDSVVVAPPFPSERLSVLIVEETNERFRLPYQQLQVFSSPQLFQWLRTNGAEWHIWDKDVDATRMPDNWRAALAVPREAVPWIVISNRSKGYSGPLPKDVASTISLLEKFQ